jgi:dTDP-4-amino-4,6-dideoxygalactose transaminase
MYYLLVENLNVRTALLQYLKEQGVSAVFHYIPLHSSPAGRHYGRVNQDLSVTDSVSERLLRLPLFDGLEDAPMIVDLVGKFFRDRVYSIT